MIARTRPPAVPMAMLVSTSVGSKRMKSVTMKVAMKPIVKKRDSRRRNVHMARSMFGDPGACKGSGIEVDEPSLQNCKVIYDVAVATANITCPRREPRSASAVDILPPVRSLVEFVLVFGNKRVIRSDPPVQDKVTVFKHMVIPGGSLESVESVSYHANIAGADKPITAVAPRLPKVSVGCRARWYRNGPVRQHPSACDVIANDREARGAMLPQARVLPGVSLNVDFPAQQRCSLPRSLQTQLYPANRMRRSFTAGKRPLVAVFCSLFTPRRQLVRRFRACPRATEDP